LCFSIIYIILIFYYLFFKMSLKNYQRRKNKTNTLAKLSSIEHRFIVNRSNKYNYGMIVDNAGKVVAMMSDHKFEKAKKTENAKKLWNEIAKIALEKWVKKVVFDRNGYLYHGRIASLCEGLREGGVAV